MPERIYTLRSWRRFAAPGILAGFAAAMLVGGLLAADPNDSWAAQVTAAVLVVIAAGTLAMVRYPRLTVSPSGISLRQVGWQVRTTWDNVERLDVQPGREELTLRRPLKGAGAWALRVGCYLPGWYGVEQRRRVDEGLWLPLDAFAWWLRRGELRRDIECHLGRDAVKAETRLR